jgi:hypothetical protein
MWSSSFLSPDMPAAETLLPVSTKLVREGSYQLWVPSGWCGQNASHARPELTSLRLTNMLQDLPPLITCSGTVYWNFSSCS